MRERGPTAAGENGSDAYRSRGNGGQKRSGEQAQTQTRVMKHVPCPPGAPLDGSGEVKLDWRHGTVKYLSTSGPQRRAASGVARISHS